MDRYVVIDADGKALNVVLWNGVDDWSPPAGCKVALEDSDEGRAAIEAANQAAAEQAEIEAEATASVPAIDNE